MINDLAPQPPSRPSYTRKDSIKTTQKLLRMEFHQKSKKIILIGGSLLQL